RRAPSQPSPPVAVKPAGGGRPDVPGRMDGTGGGQKLLPPLRGADPPRGPELHPAPPHAAPLRRRLTEVLPTPARRTRPEVAPKLPHRPGGGNTLPVDGPHSQSPPSGPRPAGPPNCPRVLVVTPPNHYPRSQGGVRLPIPTGKTVRKPCRTWADGHSREN